MTLESIPGSPGLGEPDTLALDDDILEEAAKMVAPEALEKSFNLCAQELDCDTLEAILSQKKFLMAQEEGKKQRDEQSLLAKVASRKAKELERMKELKAAIAVPQNTSSRPASSSGCPTCWDYPSNNRC